MMHNTSLLALTLSCCIACERGDSKDQRNTSSAPPVVTLDSIAVIGAESDSIWPAPMTSIVRGSDGRFFIGPTDHPGTFAVYSPEGRFVTAFGRSGKGPGEYSSVIIKMTRGPADSIGIYDVLQGRRTIVDADGVPLRMHPIPHQINSVATTAKGRIIVNADIRTPARVGFALHQLDRDGAVDTSWMERPNYRGPKDVVMKIGTAADDGVWAVDPNTFGIQHFDSTNVLTHTVQAITDWSSKVPTAASAPAPSVLSIHQVSEQFLWVVIAVAVEKEWQTPIDQDKEDIMSISFGNNRFDTVVEVIDLRTGRRAATRRFDELLVFGSGDGVLYRYSEATDGRVVITAFSPTLSGDVL